MGTKELRTEIDRSLDRMPDALLADILELLHRVEKKEVGITTLDTRLSEILREDRSLLQRLAQ